MSVVPPRTIGIDFDNTLISYDDVMERLAVERKLLTTGSARGKKQIRDRIRRLPDGEMSWQVLQAEVYGPRIAEGRMMDGARAFLEECRRRGISIFVVSHKTRLASAGDGRTDLRDCARGWMKAQGFFDPKRLGLKEEHVFFEPTRQEKAGRIAALGCALFIDDLEETFQEPSFPAGVRRILFGAERWPGGPEDVECAPTWNDILSLVFDGQRPRDSR